MIYSIVAEPEEGKIYKRQGREDRRFRRLRELLRQAGRPCARFSQIENRRLNHPSDVLKEGQEVWVKLLGFDDRGKVRLAMKMVNQETGEEEAPEPRKKKGDDDE